MTFRNGVIGAGDSVTSAEAPRGSQDQLAAIFVERFGDQWRYVSAWNAWYGWDGTRWRRDETRRILDVIRQVCREVAIGIDATADRRRIASRATIRAVEGIASSDPLVALAPDAFDADPYLLNTPAGIVDLRSGETGPHDPAQLMSRITQASSCPGCPRWSEFLGEITGGDRELQRYLQRVCGYCLTGSTKEQVFFFLHGSGANGKSVLVNTVARILSDYSGAAGQATFMTTRHPRHSTELAGLAGRRLITVSETEEGHCWSESLIKSITGGEPLRVRFTHRDDFEYVPGYKLIFTGNHKPRIRGVGEAMRRRLHLVPFSTTIPEDQRDPDLIETLLKESDGILQWMIEGCVDWQKSGLAPPSTVQNAVRDYFVDEDLVGQWIEQRCVTRGQTTCSSACLYESWSRWAEAAGVEKVSQKSLGASLAARGFQPTKVNGARGWRGIAVKPDANP